MTVRLCEEPNQFMINIIRTDSANPDFQSLVTLLDADLKIRDGADHAFYAQFNSTGNLKYTVVAYVDDQPAGSGALRWYTDDAAEIKRMFVKPGYRGQGIAKAMLRELETWAAELNFSSCILETGQNQPEAIALYTGMGFNLIPNYGPYAGINNSVCMKKSVVR